MGVKMIGKASRTQKSGQKWYRRSFGRVLVGKCDFFSKNCLSLAHLSGNKHLFTNHWVSIGHQNYCHDKKNTKSYIRLTPKLIHKQK